MPLESATFVNQLDQTRPTATDVKSEGDDVMRLIKSTLKNSFPNVGGAMNANHTELNRLVGVTEDVQPRLSATLSAPNGETLNRLPASGSRLGGFLTFNASTGQPEIGFSLTVAAGNSLGIFSVSNNTTFFTNGTEKMRLTSAGDLAVGRTAAGARIDALSNSSSLLKLENSGGVGCNIAMLDASFAGGLGMNAGALQFFAGGATNIRAVLESGGNFAVGRTVAGARIDALASTSSLVKLENNGGLGCNIAMLDTGFAGGLGMSNGALQFFAGGATTEQARIDSSGNFITRVNTSAPTLSVNQQMVFALTSNTNLRISVRGTDGTTRVANITLA